MKISEITRGRDNNLDLIRFIAASLVIFCHAFPICLGGDNVDFLGQITRNQMHFGNLAVCILFFYGGFLISKSAERLHTTKAYFKARCMRIFPCLIAVTLILTFVVGPIITSLPMKQYFGNINTYKYLLNSVFVLIHDLPGVFEHNIFNATVNGPLWTLPIEFLCYIMCFIILKMNCLNEKCMKWLIPLFFLGYIGASYILGGNATLQAALRPVGMFFMGIVVYAYKDKIEMKPAIAWLSLLGLVVSAYFNVLGIAVFIFLSYFLLYVGFGTKHKVSTFAKYGEISYGMYLCGWPIQQIVCEKFGGSMNPYLNFIITLPISIVCGLLLCKCVDKPVMRIFMKKE